MRFADQTLVLRDNMRNSVSSITLNIWFHAHILRTGLATFRQFFAHTANSRTEEFFEPKKRVI